MFDGWTKRQLELERQQDLIKAHFTQAFSSRELKSIRPHHYNFFFVGHQVKKGTSGREIK